MTSRGAIDAARRVLEEAIERRVFPAASAETGSSAGPLWTEALGGLTFDAARPRTGVETLFDLASLTKVIATTTIVMDLVRRDRVGLDDRVSAFFDEWRGADREHVVLRDLLEHASGLAARLVDPPPPSRREFVHEICRMPLEYPPRTRAVYSDLDFILLGFLAADRGGASLAGLFAQIVTPDAAAMTFEPTPAQRLTTAPTVPLAEDPRRGRTLTGEVHDTYAAALGGAAGHAGLFGTVSGVGRFARVVLAAARGESTSPPPFTPSLLRMFTGRSAVPGSSRALGWDTMLPTSSCGTRMSSSAFGHVGFTGTSLWIDPGHDRYFVLLTNRAFGDGSLDAMREVRRAFHDALAEV